MSTIVTRAGKGSALTWTEGDANVTNLNNDKMEKSTPVLAGNLDVVTYSITTTTTNGNIVIEPNGTGDVHLVTDALRVGDLNTEARISTYGTGDLVLTTNEGNDPDPTITIGNGANANITLTPSGTGDVYLTADTVRVGDSNANATITTNGTGDLTLDTNSGTNSGSIVILDGANGNITLTPNGSGRVVIDGISHPIADGTANQVLQTNGSGVLSFATQSVAVSTGISGLGSGVATFLATPSSANLISAVTDETGTGALVFATSPTLVTPALGTPASGNLTNCTVNGTDPIGYRDLPAVGSQSGSYSIGTADIGKYVEVASGGSITIPNSTFAAGDVVVIVNNHTAAITITCSITDAYIAGTNTDKATVSLATRGIANIFFVSATRCIITGNVS